MPVALACGTCNPFTPDWRRLRSQPILPMFLYRIQPVRAEVLQGGATEFESSKIQEHFTYLKHLTERGVVFLAGRTTNTDYSSFGIVILRAESENEARDIMNSDPAVKNRVFRAELFPYSMALLNDKARD